MFDYDGIRAIVTGGGGTGMGSVLTRELIALGAEVHVLDLADPPEGVASFQRVDLSSPEAIDAAVAAVPGDVDRLFNCVGVAGNRTTPLQTMVINFLAVAHLSRRVVERMPAGGAVTTVTSRGGSDWRARLSTWLEVVDLGFDDGIAWLEAHPDLQGYRPSKEVANVWVMTTAVEWGPLGIRHNAVLPGPTASGMYAAFVETSGAEYMAEFPVPLGGRPLGVEDQADALLFLGSRRASAISGELLVVDGGTNAGLATGRVAMPKMGR